MSELYPEPVEFSDINSATPVPKPTPTPTIPKVVSDALEILTKDTNFVNNLETSVNNILKDGKVDHHDIPEFILLITEAYNAMTNIRLERRDLPLLIKLIFNFMVEKLDLIPVDARPDFERIVESALRLVMLQPAVSRGVNNCIKLFGCCNSSSTNVAE